MKKKVFALLTLLVLLSLVLSACGSKNAPATQVQAPAEKPLKIAFFVSDLSNVFHQVGS